MIPLVLLIGLAFGALMGYMIHYFKLQPFIVTLAGQFFMRGMCAVISTESIPISDEFYKTMALTKVTLLGGRIYFYVFIAIVVLLVSLFVLKFTRFGRTVYAVGGNEQSAILMGLPVARTKVAVYAISSFAQRWPAWCSASIRWRAIPCRTWAWSSMRFPPPSLAARC